MEQLSNWFWQDFFWFPRGMSFEDFKDQPGLHYPKIKDLMYFSLFGSIFIIHLPFEQYVLKPIAKSLGIPDEKYRKPAIENARLEKFYKKVSKKPSLKEIDGLAKQLDWTTHKIQKWFRRRRMMGRAGAKTKFCDSAWNCIVHIALLICGIVSIWDSGWFWNTKLCWENYPHQDLSYSTYIYYMLQGGRFTYELVTVKLHLRRKDYLEVIIHHIVALLLISLSYATNFIRMGSLIFMLHEISDVFLEAGKCCVYLKWMFTANVIFVFFTVIFFLTRLGIYPFWLLYSTFIESGWFQNPCPSYYFYTGLLVSLQILHVFWSFSIIKVIRNKFIKRNGLNDVRSDSEEQSSDEEGPGLVSPLNNNVKTRVPTQNGVRTLPHLNGVATVRRTPV